jgi:hypothetical protein
MEIIEPMVHREAVALIAEHHAAGRDVVVVSTSGAELVEPIAAILEAASPAGRPPGPCPAPTGQDSGPGRRGRHGRAHLARPEAKADPYDRRASQGRQEKGPVTPAAVAR